LSIGGEEVLREPSGKEDFYERDRGLGNWQTVFFGRVKGGGDD